MVGAGHQSAFQLRAAAAQRDFKKVVAWNRSPEKLQQLETVAVGLGLEFEAVSSAQLAANADVIITITSAFGPLLADADIRPGTHIACMGTDTKGKQEIDPEIMARARVFTDEIAQSISIGEAQHAFVLNILKPDDITPIGDVINGQNQGRIGDDDVTLFDGTGVGLQDLAVASAAVKVADARGLAMKISL
jgi:ornithine cyclodeaminase